MSGLHENTDVPLRLVVRQWLRKFVRTTIDATFRPRMFLQRWEGSGADYLVLRPALAAVMTITALVAWFEQRRFPSRLEQSGVLRFDAGPVADACFDIVFSLFAVVGVWGAALGTKLSARWLGGSVEGWKPAVRVTAFAGLAGLLWCMPLYGLVFLGLLGHGWLVAQFLTNLLYTAYGVGAVYRLSPARAFTVGVVTLAFVYLAAWILLMMASFVWGFEAAQRGLELPLPQR